MQVVEDHQLSCETREDTSLIEADPLCVELREHATVPRHGNLKNFHQEALPPCLNTSAADLRSSEPYSSAKSGEVICSKSIQKFSMSSDEKSIPNYDQEVDNTLIFEGESNLNLKANHCFSLRAECEHKDDAIVPSIASNKSVQDEVHHDLMDLKF